MRDETDKEDKQREEERMGWDGMGWLDDCETSVQVPDRPRLGVQPQYSSSTKHRELRGTENTQSKRSERSEESERKRAQIHTDGVDGTELIPRREAPKAVPEARSDLTVHARR